MKRIFTLLAIIAFVASCTAAENIPGTNFSLLLPDGAIVDLLPEDSPSYSGGMRVAVSSHTPDGFIELMENNNTKIYFSFYLYEPAIYLDQAEWIAHACMNQSAAIKREYKNGKFIVVQMERCGPQTTFGIQEGNTWYTIRSSPDTYNHDLVWEILKTVR